MIVLLLVVFIVGGASGVDTVDNITSDQWTCLKQKGIVFASVRCWKRVGFPDVNCPYSVQAAHVAGIDIVDVYMTPCIICGDPKGQLTSLVQQMNDSDVHARMIWLDIQDPQNWTNDQSKNKVFINQLLKRATDLNVTVGIFTTKGDWTNIVGSWNGASSYQLWYVHNDGTPSFSDFKAFGGWNKPYAKQYRGNTSMCNTSVHLDWLPGNSVKIN